MIHQEPEGVGCIKYDSRITAGTTIHLPVREELTRRSRNKVTVRWQTMLLLLLELLLCCLALAAASTSSRVVIDPPCPSSCGNVSIPYPFGIGEGCFREGFDITCNDSTHIPYLSTGNLAVVDIQLSQGLLTVNHYAAYDCYNEDGSNNTYNKPRTDIRDLPNYKFSDVRNKFFAIGCDTIGYIWTSEPDFWTGCLSHCSNRSVVTNGTCSGIGCCTAPIPKNLRNFTVLVDSFSQHKNCWDFNPCGYGFLADEGWLNFSLASLTDLREVKMAPVTLDWAIMGQTCDQALHDNSTYACVSPNSNCSNSTNGPGYLCHCSQGFLGNPYLPNGCQDIDECAAEHPCVRRCKNTNGSYECSCPWYMRGDGKKSGSGCRSILMFIYLALGNGMLLFLVMAAGSSMYRLHKKKKIIDLEAKFFKRNGGTMIDQLEQQIPSTVPRPPSRRIWIASEELRVATDNYNQSRILGQGGAGTVYKGVLQDHTEVAIKKAKIASSKKEEKISNDHDPNDQIEQFLNEVIILSRVDHPNVVKLLGCCLETEVPELVYEFVPNGTLSQHIHGDHHGSLSLETRLRIAKQVAQALSHLHNIPIYHRDVKSANILLDQDLTAKVSDFGASILVPLDEKSLATLVIGTFGYLDPEYMQSGQFTAKSDVYSFGAVLIELLTGKKPADMNLAMLFISGMSDGRLLDQVLEKRVVEEGDPELLQQVAELARSCISVKGEERPSMCEVATELVGLQARFKTHPWAAENEEERENLLVETRGSAAGPAIDGNGASILANVPFDVAQ